MDYISHYLLSKQAQVFHLTFPHNDYIPTLSMQFLLIFFISFDCASELWKPVLLSTGWRRCMRTALMSMPETAVYKNYCTVLWKNNVRFSRQITPMQAESETKFMEKRTNFPFRRRIGRTHSTHDIASLFWWERIHCSIQLLYVNWDRSRTHQ